MNIDGVFLHYLISELSSQVKNNRINKFFVRQTNEFAFTLSNHCSLFVSLNSNSPHIRITKEEFIKSNKTNPFLSILRKYSEGSIIKDIYQNENDRSLTLEIESFDELGYSNQVKFVIELYGRNANFIILDKDDIIIDCYKRLLPSDDDKRILVPKGKYNFIYYDTNPYKEEFTINSHLQGVSQLLLNEMEYLNDTSIINKKIDPVLIKVNNKYFFYAFNLTHLNGEVTHFDNLSSLLEYYFYSLKNDNKLTSEQNDIKQYLQKAIKRSESKLIKQKDEKTQAESHLGYEKIGNLLSSNLHLLKKGLSEITVNDFYDNNKPIKIQINPELTPSQNLNSYYNKYKKAKRSLDTIDVQISNTINEINYYNLLLDQLDLAKSSDISEIQNELKLTKKVTPKKQTPNIAIYKDEKGNSIFVGKNNIQNNYLTHTYAKNTDYFFHVTSYSGSHTILRCEKLTDELITLAASIACLYSKSKNGSNVPVDYTLVKYVKKVPGTFGSFVTYTNQKTTYVTVNEDELLKKVTRIK